jgi:uncharacterized protein
MDRRREHGLGEPLVAFFAATALASGFFWLGWVVPSIRDNLHGIVAIIFLYGPWLVGRIRRVPFDYRAAGVSLQPLSRNISTLLLGLVLTWPVFLVGFFQFYGSVCQETAPEFLRAWWRAFSAVCPMWLGVSGIGLRFPPDFLWLSLSQILVVALPEEVFFRGYLYQRLEARYPSRRRFLGADLGPAIWITSVLFAVGHVLVDFDPRRLAVFFPGMVFGWMRARSGSVAAGVLYHALCNLLSDVLHTTYFR